MARARITVEMVDAHPGAREALEEAVAILLTATNMKRTTPARGAEPPLSENLGARRTQR